MSNFKLKQNETSWENRIVQNDLILQSINEGVCVIDKDNRISFANDSALQMLGWKREDLLWKRYEKVLFGADFAEQSEDEAIINPIEFACTENEKIHVNSETFYRQNGTMFLVEYDCIPLCENDETVGVVITFDDISERRDLEIAVAEARDAALASAREKANFLANMSHEIRTPLNGIIGISGFLEQTNLSAEQKDYVETLNTSANLLLDIVNDILDFSKIEAGKLELEETDFDLREIIAETIKLFIPQAFKRRNKLEFEIEENVQTALCGDAGRLRQILHNLLSNAVKFTEEGKVKLKILQGTDDFLRFEVSDTGIGIEKDKQAEIFEPFAQADVSTTRRFGGTGLGLAISKQIVQMMGGKIGVESEAGKGAKFWFTAKIACQQNPEKSLAADKNVLLDKSEIKVLVVEDNPVNQEVALGRLRQLGIAAELAENGLEAVEAVKNNDYDLVLMDCRMPKMDGYEATRKIRQISKNLKIVAMTASVTADEREKCLAAGMDDYLSKPMTNEALEQTLDKHLLIKIADESAETDFIQHPLAEIIEAKTLKNFLEIEERGEKNFVREMLNLYLKHSETQLCELKSAVANRNLNLVKNKTHALRGSSANIGLTNLFQEFNNLEQTVESDWLTAEQILNVILEKFAELKEKVSQLSS
jgi:PAS domain S-box-containing protein